MKDIQSQVDHRHINISKVGVKNISYPVTVLDKAKKVQQTVATVNMYVNLPHLFKGTHMSRFIEILNRFHGNINLKSFHNILSAMKRKLQAEASHFEIEFPYFLKKKTSNANAVSIGEYRCRMHGSLSAAEALTLEIRVPIAPPMPAQIGNGLPRSLGHWGFADICLQFKHFIWVEDLIQLVEEVTAHNLDWTYKVGDHGDCLTVETITKALGEKLSQHQHIKNFSVTVENLSEGFSTFASLEWPENSTAGNTCAN